MNKIPTGQITCMGAVETQPTGLFVRLVSPTDFDFAFENMRVRIKDTYSFSDGWDLLGPFGAPLKRWLTLYIEISSELKEAYAPGEHVKWALRFYEHGYLPSHLDAYFSTFYKLYLEGQISKNVYMPYTYVPTKTNIGGWVQGSVGLLVLATAAGIFFGLRRK